MSAVVQGPDATKCIMIGKVLGGSRNDRYEIGASTLDRMDVTEMGL